MLHTVLVVLGSLMLVISSPILAWLFWRDNSNDDRAVIQTGYVVVSACYILALLLLMAAERIPG